MIAMASLGVIAMLAFALSFVAFLVQTSRHRPSRGWAAAEPGVLTGPLLPLAVRQSSKIES